jgi:hypothetical protein
MSFLPSFLRPAALAIAALVLNPFIAGTATVATVAAVTVSQAEAGRSRVQDHRTPRCIPRPNRGCPR